MEIPAVVALLRATRMPGQQQASEEQLLMLNRNIGFPPVLLQIVASEEVDLHTRQAAAVYLKNMITRNWHERDSPIHPETVFCIAEQDRAIIRNSIIETTFRPREDLISKQLATCINTIVRHDFPNTWPQIIDKISHYLQSPHSNHWFGALLSLYQITKLYSYSSRGPLIHAMKILMNPLYRLMINILPDDSDDSLLLQKQILKIYFTLIEFSLPLEIITKEIFAQWMEILRLEAEKVVGDPPQQLEDEDRAELPIWKMKKWAVRILHRLFNRYGSPGNVGDTYIEFAPWYLTTFSGGILQAMLQILDQHRNKFFVTTRVLQYSLNYITIGVNHRHSWKFLKMHMSVIIQEIIFPIMCHSDANEELFINDPKAYLRLKTDVFDEFLIPLHAANNLLIQCCKKKKDMLLRTMQFCIYVLSSDANTYNARQKDGALHMVGSLANVLLKRNIYKDRIEEMLAQHVLPECSSTYDHMRARACWVLHCFAGANIKSEQLLSQIMRFLIHSLLNDASLPVNFEAAIGLQSFLSEAPSVERFIIPEINNITWKLLELLRLTENDDLTAVIQKLLFSFAQHLTPILVDITDHLANSFVQIFEDYPTCDEKAITSMALLNTIDTVMTLMIDHDEILRSLQPKVLFVVGHIFQSGVTDFYEDAFSLIYNMTSQFIDAQLWPVLTAIYEVFDRSGQEYFTEMMPTLHNYITIDTNAFLSNVEHIENIFNMCRVILNGDYGEDPECHAAKLLEIMILQCKGRINQAIPSFMQLALNRLTRDIKTSELRVMCLQVVIAALYYDPKLFLSILNNLQINVTSDSVMSHFVTQWITDTDCFLGIHDRRLSIIGFCTLLSLDPSYRPSFGDSLKKIMPSLMLLFDGLKKAYESRDALEEEIDSEGLDEGDIFDDYDGQSSDEEEEAIMCEKNKSSGLSMSDIIVNLNDNLVDNNDDDNFSEAYATPLESYTTPLEKQENGIDEYLIFQDLIIKMSSADEAFLMLISESLLEEHKKIFQDVMETANKRRANREAFNPPVDQTGPNHGFTFPPPM